MNATYRINGRDWPQHRIDAAAVLLLDGHDWREVPRLLREQHPDMLDWIGVTVAARWWVEQGCPS